MLSPITASNIWFLIKGLGVALEILAALLTIGFLVGGALAMVQVYAPRKWYIQGPIRVFDRIVRGIPILLLLFTFYFGLSDVLNISPMLASIVALGIRSSAYQAQIFRSALLSVPPGQLSAAKAMGFTRPHAIWTIAIPLAFRYALGPWTNEFSSELKATSLVYVIGVSELTNRASTIISNAGGYILLVFAVTALLYFVVNKTGNSLLYGLEARLRFPGFERAN